METLARPADFADRNGPAFWIDEAIWGHRFHDEQTPWLTFLEFMSVFLSEYRSGRALIEISPNSLTYRPQIQLRLRNLVFNNPHINTILAGNHSDEAAWSLWLKRMENTTGGIDQGNFEYIRDHFESFKDFAAVIKFLQGSSIEGSSNKRWSSKFVFPFGESALYEDLNVSPQGSYTNDRRFFARSGELLYLILCRGKSSNQLRDLLIERFFTRSSAIDGLLKMLQGESQQSSSDRTGAFLPCAKHRVFDTLSEDWVSILSLPMPAYDAIPHLVTMAGLNILLYKLDRASEVLGCVMPPLICEIISARKTVLRDLSADSYLENNLMPQQAIGEYITKITHSPYWQTAISSDDPIQESIEVLRAQFDWPGDLEEVEGITLPDEMIGTLVQRAVARHRQHVGKIHGTWSRSIGLSSRRSSRRIRYAPTDSLIKTLVICCVDKRMEFRDFLSLIHSRYGLVIGDIQARDIIDRGDADHKDFSENSRRLEDRLASMGLLKRLSDSCAYVENPFERE